MAYGFGSTHSTSANLTVYMVRRFLAMLRAKLRATPLATMSEIPVRAGHTVCRWILPVEGTSYVNTTAISEFGTASEVATLTWTTYTATISVYGIYSKFSELQDKSWLPQAKNSISDSFAYGASRTIDQLMLNNADDTTAYICSGDLNNNTGTVASTDTMTAQDVVAVGGFFDEKDAEGFDNFGGDYVLLIHGRPAKQLQSHVEPGGATSGVELSWADLQSRQMPGYRKLERYELGTYAGVSVQRTNMLSTQALTSATTPASATGTVTAYKNIAFAKDAIGRCNLDMRNFTIRTISPENVDKSDPLGLFGTVGWMAKLGHAALDVNNRAIVLYTAI